MVSAVPDLPRLTLDRNCIIDLEENRPEAEHLRALIELHETGKIRLSSLR